jgi:2-iminobutanoate/2-iminopropanoate deaminase
LGADAAAADVRLSRDGGAIAGSAPGAVKQEFAMARLHFGSSHAPLSLAARTRDFGAFNKVYATYFSKNSPARTTLEARPMIDIRIEIEAVAYKPL